MRFSAILFHCKLQKDHEQYYQTDISNTSSSQDMAFCIMTSHTTQSLRPWNHWYKQFCFTARCVQPAYARTFRAMVTFVVGMLGFCVWEPRETTTPFVVAKITQLTQCQVMKGLNAKHFVRVACSDVAMFCVSSTCQMCAELEWPLRSCCRWHSCLAHKSRTLDTCSLSVSLSW